MKMHPEEQRKEREVDKEELKLKSHKREREREICNSRVYENESLRGGKDGVRGYEGVVRGGG